MQNQSLNHFQIFIWSENPTFAAGAFGNSKFAVGGFDGAEKFGLDADAASEFIDSESFIFLGFEEIEEAHEKLRSKKDEVWRMRTQARIRAALLKMRS